MESLFYFDRICMLTVISIEFEKMNFPKIESNAKLLFPRIKVWNKQRGVPRDHNF